MGKACVFFIQIIRKVIFGRATVSETTLKKKNWLPYGSLLYIVPSESTRRKNKHSFSFFPPSQIETLKILKTSTHKTLTFSKPFDTYFSMVNTVEK